MAVGNKLIERHIELLDGSVGKVDRLVGVAQSKFWEQYRAKFLNKLETKGGKLLNTAANKAKISNIDAIFKSVMEKDGFAIGLDIKSTIDELLAINLQQYKGFGTVKRVGAIADAAQAQIYDLLGLSEAGKLKPGGFLETLITNKAVPAQLKKTALQAIVSKANVTDFADGMRETIVGDPDRGQRGLLKDAQKEGTDDVVATADRIIAETYRDNLGLRFAIYEGSIIKTTRQFCKEHAGKVYHVSEIEKFNPQEAKPKAYNPFTDLGGYNCRHFLNWISDALALRLRPDAAKFISKDESKEE
jgi:hypothetical protein